VVADADWYDFTLGADTWWQLHEVAPRQAALLLHGCDPLNEQPGLETSTSDETRPEHFKRLKLAFEDLARHRPQPRTLAEWVGFARQSGLHYHSWVDRYAQAQTIAIPAAPASVPVTTAAAGSPSRTPALTPASMASGTAAPASPPAPALAPASVSPPALATPTASVPAATPAPIVVLVPVPVPAPASASAQAESPTQTPVGGQGQRARWTDQKLQALWDDSKRFGCTQAQLASKYSVSRQRIAALLKRAEERFSVHRASPFPFPSRAFRSQ